LTAQLDIFQSGLEKWAYGFKQTQWGIVVTPSRTPAAVNHLSETAPALAESFSRRATKVSC
jgi:hypothetical protein